MIKDAFDNIMLIGRGGCGKSEFLEFLNHLTEYERLKKYYIGRFYVRDDFPWIFQMFRDEDLWEKLGRPRTLAHKTGEIYETLDYDIYKFTTLKFNQEIQEKYLNTGYYKDQTLIIEFARGREDGYKTSLSLFMDEILEHTAIFYLDNTFEESMRRNTIRSSEDDPNQTILKHKVPVKVMEYYYKTHDWQELTGGKMDGTIEIRGIKIPFVTVWNMPECHDFGALEERYSPALKKLWSLYNDLKQQRRT